MTAKEYLSQAFVIRKMVNAKQSRIKDLCGLQSCLNDMQASVDPQSVRLSVGMAGLRRAILGIVEELVADIKKLLEVQEEIGGVIANMGNDDYRAIFYERYVNFKQWTTIAKDGNYSLRHVYKLRRQGLAEVDRLLRRASRPS